jgi:hypothetical protein
MKQIKKNSPLQDETFDEHGAAMILTGSGCLHSSRALVRLLPPSTHRRVVPEVTTILNGR